jgi:hypothetical protein
MPIISVLNLTHLENFQIGTYISYLLTAQVKNVSNNYIFVFEQSLNIDIFN